MLNETTYRLLLPLKEENLLYEHANLQVDEVNYSIAVAELGMVRLVLLKNTAWVQHTQLGVDGPLTIDGQLAPGIYELSTSLMEQFRIKQPFQLNGKRFFAVASKASTTFIVAEGVTISGRIAKDKIVAGRFVSSLNASQC